MSQEYNPPKNTQKYHNTIDHSHQTLSFYGKKSKGLHFIVFLHEMFDYALNNEILIDFLSFNCFGSLALGLRSVFSPHEKCRRHRSVSTHSASCYSSPDTP